jgi:RecB family exonuclease
VADPIELSDSQIKNFQKCPRKWAYNKILKLDPDESKDNLILGSAWHDGAEEYILRRDMNSAINLALKGITEGKPTNLVWQLAVVPAMLIGWATHFLPGFEQEYQYVACEEWFTYEPNPEILRMRGYKDVVAIKRAIGKRTVWDYKTSSPAYAQDLGKSLQSNNQLARYAIAERREKGDWPSHCGLIFAGKPKSKDPETAAYDARTNANLYTKAEQQVTPQFATFALAVEASDLLYAQQMKFYRDQYRLRGPSAMEDVPANFDNCLEYGTMCGFASGCHAGCPAHRSMK